MDVRGGLAGWEPLVGLDQVDETYVWRDPAGLGASSPVWLAGSLTGRQAVHVVATGPTATRELAVGAIEVVLGSSGEGRGDPGGGAGGDEATPSSGDPSTSPACEDADREEADRADDGDGSQPSYVETGIRVAWTSADERDPHLQPVQVASLAETGVVVQTVADDVVVTILDQVPDRDPELACYSEMLLLAGWERQSVETIHFVTYGQRLDHPGVSAEFPGALTEGNARRICEQARSDGARACVAGTADTGDGGSPGVVQLFAVDQPDSAAYLTGLLPPGANTPDLEISAITTTPIPTGR